MNWFPHFLLSPVDELRNFYEISYFFCEHFLISTAVACQYFTARSGKRLPTVFLRARQTFSFIHASIKNKLSTKIGFGELKRSLLFTFAKFGQVGFGSGLYLQYDWLMGFWLVHFKINHFKRPLNVIDFICLIFIIVVGWYF